MGKFFLFPYLFEETLIFFNLFINDLLLVCVYFLIVSFFPPFFFFFFFFFAGEGWGGGGGGVVMVGFSLQYYESKYLFFCIFYTLYEIKFGISDLGM